MIERNVLAHWRLFKVVYADGSHSFCLTGQVYNHRHFRDGTGLILQAVKEIRCTLNTPENRSFSVLDTKDRFYLLDLPDPSYREKFPQWEKTVLQGNIRDIAEEYLSDLIPI